jgi:hypothetical protein
MSASASQHRTHILDIPIMGFEYIKQGELSRGGITRPHFYPMVDRSCENTGTVEVDVKGDYFVVVGCIELLDERHPRFSGDLATGEGEVSKREFFYVSPG